MKIPDSNVLLYAINGSVVHHRRAHQWLQEGLSGQFGVGFTWQALLACVRVGSNPRGFPHPLSPSQLLDIVDNWLRSPAALVLQPTDRHSQVLAELLAGHNNRHLLVMDAHLAAIAIEHNATLVTFDRDFHDFDGLKVELLR